MNFFFNIAIICAYYIVFSQQQSCTIQNNADVNLTNLAFSSGQP